MTVGCTLRNISMDAVKITQVIVKNITKVQTPVEKVPGSGSRGQSASVHVYVGKLQAEGNTMKDATEWKDSVLSFYSPNWT